MAQLCFKVRSAAEGCAQKFSTVPVSSFSRLLDVDASLIRRAVKFHGMGRWTWLKRGRRASPLPIRRSTNRRVWRCVGWGPAGDGFKREGRGTMGETGDGYSQRARSHGGRRHGPELAEGGPRDRVRVLPGNLFSTFCLRIVAHVVLFASSTCIAQLSRCDERPPR